MIDTKFTPGPWKYHIGLDYVLIESANAHNNSCICEYKNYSDDDGESEANAKLLAAAPQLLEALEDLLSSIPKQDNDHDWWEDSLTKAVSQAGEAIKKATEQ